MGNKENSPRPAGTPQHEGNENQVLHPKRSRRAHPVTLRVPPLYTRGIIILLTNFCMFVHETTHHAFATAPITSWMR